jgi:ArsR family transcriptional regulator, arsenate/arsenite/antimonite-responsive transcriptional repressor
MLAMTLKHAAKIAKALGDETRFHILEAIAADDEVNCGDICSVQHVGSATVSHHLRILSEAGLVDSRRQGQFVFYRLLPDTLSEFSKMLTGLVKKGSYRLGTRRVGER